MTGSNFLQRITEFYGWRRIELLRKPSQNNFAVIIPGNREDVTLQPDVMVP